MQTAAMITAEWTMRNSFFSRWGFPFELAAGLYDQLGRKEEARDTARLALKQPWWTVEDLKKCASSICRSTVAMPGTHSRLVGTSTPAACGYPLHLTAPMLFQTEGRFKTCATSEFQMESCKLP